MTTKKLLILILAIVLLGGIGLAFRKTIYGLVYYRYFEIDLSRTEIQHDPNDLAWDIFEVTEFGDRLAHQWGYGDRTSFGGKFVSVSWFVANDSKELRKIDIEQITFWDQNNRSFEPIKYGPNGSCGGGRLAMAPKIAPGLQCHFVFLYEVPRDATDFRLAVTYRAPRTIWR